MAERLTVIPASYLFLVREDEILMSRRFQTGYEDGKYSLPAGHVEPGETLTQTLLRETKEEIGVTLREADVQVIHVMHRETMSTYHTPQNYLDVFFLATEWEGEPEILEPEKCDHLQWFSYSDLPTATLPYIRQAIECWQKKIYYSEYGWK